MLGAIAAVIGVAVTLLGFLPPNQLTINFQLYGAKLIAPKGYDVVPSELEIIPENSEFIRGIGGTALLTRHEITFAVESDYRSHGTYVLLGGKRRYLKRGDNLAVGDTECFIWLYHIDTEKNMYRYQLKC
ncbi:hypothetical protein GCM10022394_08180 [Zobellella aerophila]|uniref:Uncharacterized protein n=2 Tax=Zobellella aerophila TaxID=870480 RepID=A0ABP6V961_9GAMM